MCAYKMTLLQNLSWLQYVQLCFTCVVVPITLLPLLWHATVVVLTCYYRCWCTVVLLLMLSFCCYCCWCVLLSYVCVVALVTCYCRCCCCVLLSLLVCAIAVVVVALLLLLLRAISLCFWLQIWVIQAQWLDYFLSVISFVSTSIKSYIKKPFLDNEVNYFCIPFLDN